MTAYTTARGSMPPEISALMRADRIEAIEAAGLGLMDTEIAMRFYIDRMPHADIGAIVGRERSTISKRLQQIEPRVSSVARSLHIPQ